MLGIITIAMGDKKYIRMAKMLALSLMQTNPGIRRAVVTDAADGEFDGYFDLCIPADAGLGPGLIHKLQLDRYSPFEETLFIDSDCLVFDSLDEMIGLCRQHSFVVFGGQISSGEWYMDVAEMCGKFGLGSIPLFNGGTYYFNDKKLAANVYSRARELAQGYSAMGFRDFRGSINEEPVIAVAMAMNNIKAVDDGGKGMRTPIGIIGPLKIDILNRKCVFNKEGDEVAPAVLHFPGSHTDAFHYRRETAKLRLMRSLPSLNRTFASRAVNLVYNGPYGIAVFIKRILKTIIRRQKFDFSNSLPVFSNQ